MNVFTSRTVHPVGLLLTLVILLAPSPAAQATLLQNGGFELGNITVDGHAETPPPWTSSVPLDPFVSWDTWHNDGINGLPPTFGGVFSSTSAPEGVRWAGGWGFENIAQQLSAPLTVGQTYQVSALIRMSDYTFGYSGRLEIYLGTGVNSYNQLVWSSPAVTGTDGWVPVSGTFVMPGTGGSLSYFVPKFAADLIYTEVYMGLDDIQLTPVPEPGLATILGLGLALAFGFRRRN